MKGNQNNLELAGGFLHYSKCKKEIQGKSTLVRVSARFNLAKVRVIGRQLQKLLGYKRLEILYLQNGVPFTCAISFKTINRLWIDYYCMNETFFRWIESTLDRLLL